jgi:lipoprotein-anchoring transpeptidase ErfK/SrfK
MKTTTITTLAFAAIASLFAGTSSCTKPQQVNPPVKTKTELLTQKGWIQKSLKTKLNNDPWVDNFASSLQCDRDNILTFTTAKTIILDNGAIKCDQADLQTFDAGTWAFSNNETSIYMAEPSSTGETSTIVTLDENTLYLSTTISTGSNIELIEETYSH